MIEPDDELRHRLLQWQSPPARPDLDERVWASFRRSRGGRRRKWLLVAAGIALVGIAHLWRPSAPPPARNVSIATITDATGFRPMANGTITVMKAGEKQ